MPLPTFVITGAQKCGTSSLAATLRRHPQVFMARPKELHYFDRDHVKGIEWYAEQFADALPRHRQRGEATPVYIYDEPARERMVETLPHAKFVVMLRDPAKRAYSHFWHSKRLGFEPLDSFEEALALEPERLQTGRRERIRFSYVDRGRYIDQLEWLEARVGRDRMHVILLEDLISDRVAVLEGLFGFLGVRTQAAHRIPPKHTNKYRVTQADGTQVVVAYPPLSQETRAQLVEGFRPYNDRLERWLGGRDLSAWNKA